MGSREVNTRQVLGVLAVILFAAIALCFCSWQVTRLVIQRVESAALKKLRRR